MPDLQIKKAIEEPELIDEATASEPSSEPKEDYVAPGDGKKLLLAVVIIVALFALILVGFKAYDHFTSAQVLDIDQLHQENLDGNLNEEEGYMYNGYSFIKVDGLWWTELQRGDTLIKIPLHFGPKETEEITITGSLSREFNLGDTVYIAIDPKVVSGYYVVAMKEISSNIGQGLLRNSVGVCTEEHYGCEEDRKILSCNNNPENLPVIELVDSTETGIELQGSCIRIKGQNYDIIKATDRLLYQWYGIMD